MAETTGNPSIQYLTDDTIVLYSEDRVCDDSRDINLHFDNRIYPYARGVYDQNYFGSIFAEHCNCGIVKTKGVVCHNCGSKVLDDREKYHRFGRIELPMYYCSELKFKAFRSFLDKHFNKIVMRLDTELRSIFTAPFSHVPSNRINKFRFDSLQFEYEPDSDTLVGTDKITDISKCSFEGIEKIFKKYKQDGLNEYLSYVNKMVLVIPQHMRPISPKFSRTGKKDWEIHEISTAYQNIIAACNEYYDKVKDGLEDDPVKHTLFLSILRTFVGRCLHKLSKLLRSSKQNLARMMFSSRIPNSGRAVIVADPNIDIDKISVPRHLFYEACGKEFVKFIQEKYNIDERKALYLYQTQSNSIEIQSLFDDFVNGDIDKGGTRKGKYIIINRQPSLHEYSMMCCKVVLSNDYTLGLPLELCRPLGGDFDGDTIAWYVVNDDMVDICIDRMSPSRQVFQKKSHLPLFMPEQDILSGLIIGTRIRRESPGKLRRFDSVESAEEFRRENPDKLKIQSLIEINGKETTIGREILGNYFNCDLNEYLESYEGYYDEPATDEDHQHLTGKNIVPLYMKLTELDDQADRVHRISKIRQFAEKVGTIYGVTPLTLEDMSKVTADSKNLDMIRKIAEDDNLTQNEKNVSMRDYYTKYTKELKKRLEKDMPDVVQRLDETAKSKLKQLMELASYQINVDLVGNVSIAETTMINGMSENDFQNHAIENRAVFGIKNAGTPESGSLTRQFVFLAFNYNFVEGKEDKKNTGIWIPANQADGRTLLDGTRFHSTNPNDDSRVIVRSLVSKSKGFPAKTITADLLSNPEMYEYTHGDNIGVSMITSLTEGLTQGALSLKHGGNLKIMYMGSELRAPFDCELDDSGEFFITVKELGGNGRTLNYFKPSNWVKSFSPKDRYKEGDVLGYAYLVSTPVAHLQALIKFIKARAVNPKKQYERNQILFSQCYAVNSGKVHFTVDNGKPKLFIGDKEYLMNTKCMYHIYEGQEVHEFDRISNGTCDMSYIFNHYSKDTVTPYYYFRDQINLLNGGLAGELLELLYVLTISRNEEDEVCIDGVISSIHEKSSFFTKIAFQDSQKSFKQVTPEGIELEPDNMSAIVLPLLLNNTIDSL